MIRRRVGVAHRRRPPFVRGMGSTALVRLAGQGLFFSIRTAI